jgi:hypothetical protein
MSTEPDSALKIDLLKVADVTVVGETFGPLRRTRRGHVRFVYT